jgi:hypothetical protein
MSGESTGIRERATAFERAMKKERVRHAESTTGTERAASVEGTK